MNKNVHSSLDSETESKVSPSAETVVVPISPDVQTTSPSAETTMMNTLDDILQDNKTSAETTVLPIPEFDDRGIIKKPAWYKRPWVKRCGCMAGWIAGVIFALLVLLQILINPVVKSLVGSLGEKYLGVPVSLKSSNIQLWRGRIDLGEFNIGNPKDGGYASKRLFHIGRLVVDLDLTSIFSSRICLEEVLVKNVEANFEGNKQFTSSNLTDVVLYLNKIVGSSSKDEDSEDGDEPGESKQKMTELPLEIEKFSIENVRVNAVSEGLSIVLERLQMFFDKGQVELGSVVIANPADYGYKTPHFFKLGQFHFEVDMQTLLTENIHIANVGVRDITVNFEADQQGEYFNIRDIVRNVKSIVNREVPIYQKMAQTKGKKLTVKQSVPAKKDVAVAGNVAEKPVSVILDIATIDNFKLNAYGQGVPVTLENITAKPAIGRVEVNRLFVHNPVNKGYASAHAFNIGNAVFDVDMNTISTPKMRIQEIRLKDADINYESSLTMTSNNISDLLNSVNIFAQIQEKKKEKNKAPKEIVITVNTPVIEPDKTADATDSTKKSAVNVTTQKKELRLQLDLLNIDNVCLHAMPKGNSVGVILPVTLPTMGPLGEDEKGMTPVEIVQHVFSTFYGCVSNAVKKAGLKVFLASGKTVKQGTDILVEQGPNVGNTVVEQGANVGKKHIAGDIVSVGKGLVRIFSSDNDDKKKKQDK